MGYAELGGRRRGKTLRRCGGLVVAVVSLPQNHPSRIRSDFRSGNGNHEKVRDTYMQGPEGRGELGLLSVNPEKFRDLLAVANLNLFPCI